MKPISALLAVLAVSVSLPLFAQAPEQELGAEFAPMAAQARGLGDRIIVRSLGRELLSKDPRNSMRALKGMIALFAETKDQEAQKQIVSYLLVLAPDAKAPAAEKGIRSMIDLKRRTPDLSREVRTYMLKTLSYRCDPASPYADAYFETLQAIDLI